MLGARFTLLVIIVSYFVLFAAQNSTYVMVTLPFIKTFPAVPMFLVIIISLIVGITFQFLTSGLGKKKIKK